MSSREMDNAEFSAWQGFSNNVTARMWLEATHREIISEIYVPAAPPPTTKMRRRRRRRQFCIGAPPPPAIFNRRAAAGHERPASGSAAIRWYKKTYLKSHWTYPKMIESTEKSTTNHNFTLFLTEREWRGWTAASACDTTKATTVTQYRPLANGVHNQTSFYFRIYRRSRPMAVRHCSRS